MISVKLYGRLGNQAFQVATCIATSLRNKTEFNIPLRTINPREWKTYFRVGISRLPGGVIYREPHFHYAPIPDKKHLYLDGYFQSERYFADYRNEVIRLMGFKWELNKGVVGIHVRRGDYALYPDKHPMLPFSYYASAIAYMWDRGYTKFKVFSDDMAWCKHNFANVDGVPLQYEFSEGKSEMQDMTELSECEHQIIANSSFSWWSAWINQNPEKIVISPTKEQWFGKENSHLDTRDLLPDSWIQMKY